MLVLGILLVCLTTVVAIALGAKANQQVRQFDESKHETFIGSKR